MTVEQLLRFELDARAELERAGVDPYSAVRTIDGRAADTGRNVDGAAPSTAARPSPPSGARRVASPATH